MCSVPRHCGVRDRQGVADGRTSSALRKCQAGPADRGSRHRHLLNQSACCPATCSSPELSPPSPWPLPKTGQLEELELPVVLPSDARCPGACANKIVGRILNKITTPVGVLQDEMRNEQGSISASHVSNHLEVWDRFPGAWAHFHPGNRITAAAPLVLVRYVAEKRKRIHRPPRFGKSPPEVTPPRREIALYGSYSGRTSSPPFVHGVCLTWRNAPGGDDGQTASVVRFWLAVGT